MNACTSVFVASAGSDRQSGRAASSDKIEGFRRIFMNNFCMFQKRTLMLNILRTMKEVIH